MKEPPRKKQCRVWLEGSIEKDGLKTVKLNNSISLAERMRFQALGIIDEWLTADWENRFPETFVRT